MYLQADSRERRLLNQAFFERIEIDSEKVSGCELAAPFAQLVASGPAAPAQRATAAGSRPGSARGNGARKAKTPNPSSKVGGLDVTSLVDENGEPTAAQKAYADNMAAACGVSVEGLEHLMKQDMKRKIAAMRMYGEQESPPTGGWQSCCKGVQTWAMGKESVFVENLERLAGLHNLNMQTVAALCGVSESAISKWRSGDRSPGFASALKIADVFQVDAGRLARADFSDLLAHELASPERYEEAEKTIARLKREWSGEEKKVVPIEKNRKRGRKSR